MDVHGGQLVHDQLNHGERGPVRHDHTLLQGGAVVARQCCADEVAAVRVDGKTGHLEVARVIRADRRRVDEHIG